MTGAGPTAGAGGPTVATSSPTTATQPQADAGTQARTSDVGTDAPTRKATDPLATPPQPRPDADTAPFWRALADGRLAMCRCQDCGRWLQPPLERCRLCAGPTAFEDVSGTGTVYSFIVQHRPTVPGYLDTLPYVVALVDLDEQPGLRLPARIVGIEPAEVTCGLRVRAELLALPGGDYTVPVFRPAEVD